MVTARKLFNDLPSDKDVRMHRARSETHLDVCFLLVCQLRKL